MNTLPTNHGEKTATEIIDMLMWASYKANRDQGLSRESLIKFGIGNDQMKARYAALNN